MLRAPQVLALVFNDNDAQLATYRINLTQQRSKRHRNQIESCRSPEKFLKAPLSKISLFFYAVLSTVYDFFI
ncbi:hypothetical protein B9G53_25775 [Pseudanabaena sp. SR411]|nr:hypothetical protein B9G53_25775 [Pseudanabaena sp. SR411]